MSARGDNTLEALLEKMDELGATQQIILERQDRVVQMIETIVGSEENTCSALGSILKLVETLMRERSLL